MAIRWFIFDWSGTISDDRRVVYAANRLMREDYGLPPVAFEDWLGTVTMTVAEHFAQDGVTVGPDALWAHYERRLGEVVAGGMRPVIYVDAIDALARLAEREGVRIGLVSSHPESHLLDEVRGYGLSDRFDAVVGSSRDKAADIARVVADWDARPDATLYVGDTVHDIRHSKRAGVLSAGITTGYHPRQSLALEQPHYLFDSLTEIARTF